MSTYQVENVMAESSVGFGTSGARGLATAMTNKVCYIYTRAFLQYLESTGQLEKGSPVAVAGDLRSSTNRIMTAVFKGVEDMNYIPLNCGKVPTPAVTLLGIQKGIPSMMVTGSHIPDDRNGIKFNHPGGEILKKDELGIKAQNIEINDSDFDGSGSMVAGKTYEQYPEDKEAEQLYAERYIDYFGPDFLTGKKIGFYQHSAVGRHLLPRILESLGATVTNLKPSDIFIPVDTEAIREEDVTLARDWTQEYHFDSIYSTDGDSDRPLVSNEKGEWLRGDVLGILTSLYLKADSVSTPVSCNSALEKSGAFKKTHRTRIGSPYVIESMQQAQKDGSTIITGYEANGGYLLQSEIKNNGNILHPLPTRDTLIAFLGLMGLSSQKNLSVSALQNEIPPRFTVSGRLKEFPTHLSKSVIEKLNTGTFENDKTSIENLFKNRLGTVAEINDTDGLRITFTSEEIVHLRPSGNAPEFRCYIEADSSERASELKSLCLEMMESWRTA